MKFLITIFIILLGFSEASQTLKFGAISTVDKSIMKQKLTPLINYISSVISKDIVFQTGIDYADTISKFEDGTYDFGFIGPSPFILATDKNKNSLKIIVGLNNMDNGYFHSVIVVRKDSTIKEMSDLKDTTFAFGSHKSTLSYYIPRYMLQKNKIYHQLKDFVFLGKHDKVAKYVIMGKYEAGAIKESVAKKYLKYLRIIKTSSSVPDFIVVAGKKISEAEINKIRDALLKPEAQKIAQSIKPSSTGFRIRKCSDYTNLKKIMFEIDNRSAK